MPAGRRSRRPRQRPAYKPKKKWLVEMKRRHMARHFHDETGNQGHPHKGDVGSLRPFGKGHSRQLRGPPDKASDRPAKSPKGVNLGYTPEVAEKYPHVARLSGGVATDHPRERTRQKANAGS